MTHAGVVLSGPLAYTFDWDRAEHLRAFRQISRRALFRRWVRILMWTFVLALVVLLSLGVWVSEGHRQEMLRGVVPWLAIIAMWFVLLRYGTGWISARAWAKRHPVGQRAVAYGITNEGIECASYPGKALLRWVGIHRAVETDEFFLFFVTWQCAQFLPKRAVPDAKQLRGVLRTHLPVAKLELGGDPGLAV